MSKTKWLKGKVSGPDSCSQLRQNKHAVDADVASVCDANLRPVNEFPRTSHTKIASKSERSDNLLAVNTVSLIFLSKKMER